MKILLPTEIAQQIRSYDRAKPVQQKSEHTTDIFLKRKSNFPLCNLDVFKDIDFEVINEVYEYFKSVKPRHRIKVINHKDKLRLVIWDDYVWKVLHEGDVGCPVIVCKGYAKKLGDSNNSDEVEYDFNEFRLDKFQDYKTGCLNNNYATYKVTEKYKAAIYDNFIDIICQKYGQLLFSCCGMNQRNFLKKYEETKFFNQLYFPIYFPIKENGQETSDEYFKRLNAQEEPDVLWFIQQSVSDGYINFVQGKKKDMIESTVTKLMSSPFLKREIYNSVNKIQSSLNKDFDICKLKFQIAIFGMFIFFFPEHRDYFPNILSELNAENYKFKSFSKIYFPFRYVHENHLEEFSEYIRNLISPSIFVNWVSKHMELTKDTPYDSTFKDTLDMFYKLFLNQDSVQVERPKRWRLIDTHDYVSGLIYKLETPLIDMPCDLIPKPIEVFTEIGKLVYFQPTTNHILAHWGKAVRNCVGSAGYYKYVVERKSLIILVTKDDKPWCTAKFTVRSGVLEADQIVQIQNKSLAPVETAAVAFGLNKVLSDLAEA